MQTIQAKLFIFFFLIFILLTSSLSYSVYQYFSAELVKEKLNQLSSLNESKKEHIKDYIQNLGEVIKVNASSQVSIEAFKSFSKSFCQNTEAVNSAKLIDHYENFYLNLVSTNMPFSQKVQDSSFYLPQRECAQTLQWHYIVSNEHAIGEKDLLIDAENFDFEYNKVHKKYHNHFKNIIKSFGFYDLFLINTQGEIIYSVFKEKDFGTSLLNGPYSKSALASVYKRSMALKESKLVLSDFRAYFPSYNKAQAFMAVPIFEEGKKIGILAAQVPLNKINSIMQYYKNYKKVGLGESGESYLVGAHQLMNSNSRFSSSIKDPLVQKEGTTIGILKINTFSVKKALAKEQGQGVIKDYRNINVLSAYDYIELFDNQHLAIISEMKEEEVLSSVNEVIKKFIWISLFILMFVSALVFIYLRKKLFNPLKYLKNEMVNISKHKDYSREFHIKGHDEFAQMQNAFSTLLKAISISLDESLKAQKSKNEFLANMSHEIRTPMNAILGFVSVIKRREKDEELKKYLDIVDSSGRNLLCLINDILDFSKMQSGSFIIDNYEFDPHTEFEMLLALYQTQMHKKGIIFDTYIDQNLPDIIYTDGQRIKQIVNNLISNAIKFTPKHGLIMVVINFNKSDSLLDIVVKDNGVGIKKDQHENIFESFTQEKGSTSREYGGSGLGLSISKSLLGLMNGEIKLESQEGEGSRFNILIPVKVIKEDRNINKTTHVLKNKKIVFINNELDITFYETMSRYLNAWDCKEVFYSSGYDDIEGDVYIVLNSLLDENLVKIIDTYEDKAVIIINDDGIESKKTNKFKQLDVPISASLFLDALIESKDIKEQECSHNEKFQAKVLVVEDSKVNRELVDIYLKEFGIEADFAEDGFIGVKKTTNKNYDLILMDIQMPLMDGVDATKLILKKEKESSKKHTPIIALTANAMKGDKEKFLSAGMDYYLSKPVSIEDIYIVLKKYVKKI